MFLRKATVLILKKYSNKYSGKDAKSLWAWLLKDKGSKYII